MFESGMDVFRYKRVINSLAQWTPPGRQLNEETLSKLGVEDLQQLAHSVVVEFNPLPDIYLRDDNITPAAVEVAIETPPILQEQIEDAFAEAYDTCTDGISPADLRMRLESYMLKYDLFRYRAPVASIVQSSGSGKSRLVREVAQTYPLAYISLDTVSSYPRGTTTIASIFSHIKSELMAISALAWVFEWLKSLYLSAGSINPADIWPQMEFPKLPHIFPINDDQDVFAAAKRALAAINNLPECFSRDGDRRRCVVVLDEAALLLDRVDAQEVTVYRLLRRASQRIARLASGAGSPLLILFLSTFARIQNFAPALHRDSARQATTGSELYAPIYQIFSFPRPVRLAPHTFSLFRKPEIIMGFGRPLWRQLLRAGAAPTAIMDLAYSKLLGGNFESASGLSLAACVTVVTGIFINPGIRDPELLAKSHLATIVDVDSDREKITTLYLYEPVVAHAALRALENLDLARVVREIRIRFAMGSWAKGHNGETIAALRCVGALLSANELSLSTDIPETSVAKFVSQLGGDKSTLPEKIARGTVSFCCFLKCGHLLQPSMIVQALRMRVALITHDQESGADIIVPFWTGKEDGIVDESGTGTIRIEVKNRKKPLSASQAEDILGRRTGRDLEISLIMETSAIEGSACGDGWRLPLVKGFPWPQSSDIPVIEQDLMVTLSGGLDSEMMVSGRLLPIEEAQRARLLSSVTHHYLLNEGQEARDRKRRRDEYIHSPLSV